MGELMDAWRAVDRNKIAALLSIIPGLGHLYKHHYLAGFGILIGGNILAGVVTVFLAPATLFISVIVLPPLYLAGVAAGAYYLPDWHGHHRYLHPWREEDPGEAD